MFARTTFRWLLLSAAALSIHCSSSTSTGSCASLAGNWSVSGCATFRCTVTQSGCSLSIGCPLVNYTGTVSGESVNFQSFDADGGVTQSCQGTLANTMLTGMCTTAASTCAFSAVKQ